MRFLVNVALLLTALATMHGPESMHGHGSLTAPMIDCFASVEKAADLRDGIAGVIVARFVNAARHSRTWSSKSVVVEMASWHPLSVQASENNLSWFGDGYRGGHARINFVATDRFSPENLAYIEERVGRPDRIFSCPAPRDWAERGKQSFDIWVFDGALAQRKLAELVVHDPMTGPFTPQHARRSFTFDPVWAMSSPSGAAALVDGHLAWRRGADDQVGILVQSKPMFLPTGRYRAVLDATSAGTRDGAAELQVVLSGQLLARTPINPRPPTAPVEFDVRNRGGPTSGEVLTLIVTAGTASSIDVSGARIECLAPAGTDFFRLFR